MNELSTAELVARLRDLGVGVSVASLSQDVLSGLVNPLMPSLETPGRGHPARWSRAAYRRCLYLARLRRIGVEGRLIPLLAYLHDGWGWMHIRESVYRWIRRGVEIDRRDLRRLGKAETAAQLDILVDSGNPNGIKDWGESILPGRRFITSMAMFGEATRDATLAPVARRLVDELGLSPSEDEVAHGMSLGQRIEGRRRDQKWSAADLADWLHKATTSDAERGRLITRALLRGTRPTLRRLPLGRSANALSCFGQRRADVQATLRKTTGRPTAPMLLADLLAHNMYLGSLLTRFELRQLIRA